MTSQTFEGVVTHQPADNPCSFWRYRTTVSPPFDEHVFNEQVLRDTGRLTGRAGAGRGNTWFFVQDGTPLVLRHYRRGGMVKHLSKCHYWYNGLEQTRAMAEFNLLLHIEALGLPAPRPFASAVQVLGQVYTASLVTYKLPGCTLAERMLAGAMLPECWVSVGKTIADFHRQGIFHADLNAHNIMIDDDGGVFLLDFDRAELKHLPELPSNNGWRLQNIQRLKRSLHKVASRLPSATTDTSKKAASAETFDGLEIAESFERIVTGWTQRLNEVV